MDDSQNERDKQFRMYGLLIKHGLSHHHAVNLIDEMIVAGIAFNPEVPFNPEFYRLNTGEPSPDLYPAEDVTEVIKPIDAPFGGLGRVIEGRFHAAPKEFKHGLTGKNAYPAPDTLKFPIPVDLPIVSKEVTDAVKAQYQDAPEELITSHSKRCPKEYHVHGELCHPTCLTCYSVGDSKL